ncbi:MAG: hypothetical protein M3Z09_12280 [Acidobacteriota bacterium]|nr:hypothetical protein [Acidobacteriota bacterium]
MFRNNGDGTFTDLTLAEGFARAGYGVGVTIGNFNNDVDAQPEREIRRRVQFKWRDLPVPFAARGAASGISTTTVWWT